MVEEARRPRRRRSLLFALLAILLILLCVLAIVILYPIIFPPGGAELTADADGPYTADEGQPITLNGAGSTGNITSYEWDFGDGTTGTGVSPTHTYEDGPADYTAKLTVTDGPGGTASDTAPVTVNNLPPTANADGPYTCQVGETITLSGMCDDPSPVDRTLLTCTWAEFSGAAIAQPSYKCPDKPGEITVTLTATDKDGASAQDSTTITVTAEHTGTLTADADGPYSGVVGKPVTFDGSGSSPAELIISYDWDFGDENKGSGVVISHTYAATGTYTVILTVADPNTQDTDTTTATITAAAENQPPTAVIKTEQIPKAEPCLRLDGSGSRDPDGKIVSYEWDLGDGNTKTGEVVEYCYAKAGDYKVTLTVTDNAGATASASKDVTVSAGADPD